MFLEVDIIIRITSSPHAHSKTQPRSKTQRQSQQRRDNHRDILYTNYQTLSIILKLKKFLRAETLKRVALYKQLYYTMNVDLERYYVIPLYEDDRRC